MIYEIRVKPFDVLIKNGMANMTSVDCATQLVDECQVKRGKRWPTTDQGAKDREENCHPGKQFTETISKPISLFCGH